MSRITDKLSTLNALRAIAGKAPLVSWKASEADLDQRIKDLTPGQNLGAKIAAEPDRTEVLKAMGEAVQNSDVTPTVLPADPILAKPARRKAIIETIAATSVAADKPTTVIDAKAASRKMRKQEKSKPAAKAKAPAKAKSTKKTTTTKSTNEFGLLLKELGLDAKKARAKLRANDMSAPYTDLVAIKRILTTDGRKKAK